ncbi:MAG: LysM peptidoglycan-binding domain-containing protein [Thiomicrorhabdus sp.]|jgi:membrane-bound lytic murein transglycosylase D|nr:LysM peptidoglycan-binding domain-containing protein [Thiomicrorhabdus sp.]
MTFFSEHTPSNRQGQALTNSSKKMTLLAKTTHASLSFSALLFLSGCVTLPADSVSTERSLQTNQSTVIKSPHLHVISQTTPDAIKQLNSSQTFHPIIWDEMHGQFHLAAVNLGHYDSQLNYFKKHPNHLNRVSKRSKPYLHFILSEVQKRDMPYEMALLPIIESSFRPTAYSEQSAVGLWQFIPSTAHQCGLDQNWWYDGRQDTIQSTQAALDYLQKLYALNNNDWLLALASYNAGIGNVYKAIKKYKKKHTLEDAQPTFWEIQSYLPKETQNYVPQLLAVSHIINQADNWGIELEPVENSPFFTEVELNQQITLSEAAKLSGVSKELFGTLNPGYLRPTTPPKGPFNILLPVKRVAHFKQLLAKSNNLFDIQWMRHKIKPGDSLGLIAEKYHTSRKAIQNLNGLKDSRIRAGKTLLIPVPSQNAYKVERLTNKSQYKGVKKIHIVSSGDSLWRIGRYYNVDTRTLCRWNNIEIQAPLRKGQQLEIRSARYDNQVTYTIKKDESLWTVAKKYNVSTDSLIRWNNIKQSKIIQPGTQVTVWQPKAPHKNYHVKNGDNLWDIAKANQLSAKQLASYNQLSIRAYLKPGQILKIPLES